MIFQLKLRKAHATVNYGMGLYIMRIKEVFL